MKIALCKTCNFSKVDLGSGQNISAPVIYPTPYGGRLEYVMPHGNLLIVHMKNKDKIRYG